MRVCKCGRLSGDRVQATQWTTAPVVTRQESAPRRTAVEYTYKGTEPAVCTLLATKVTGTRKSAVNLDAHLRPISRPTWTPAPRTGFCNTLAGWYTRVQVQCIKQKSYNLREGRLGTSSLLIQLYTFASTPRHLEQGSQTSTQRMVTQFVQVSPEDRTCVCTYRKVGEDWFP
jgi:hypothetical protein